MTDGNLVRYPVSPGQFFAMLERVGQLGEWHIYHSPFSRPTVTYFSLYAGGGTLPNEVALVYGEGEQPIVKLGRLRFDLMRLFEPGMEWHPAAYRANSFMPWQFKEFLDQLFAVLIGDRNVRAHALRLAA